MLYELSPTSLVYDTRIQTHSISMEVMNIKIIYHPKYHSYVEDIHGPLKDCIPFQLQKLFARLQLSSEMVASTSDLITSFNLDPNVSFQQQDVN